MPGTPPQDEPARSPRLRVRTAGDRALLVEVEGLTREELRDSVASVFTALLAAAIPAVRNLHPAESSVLVEYDPLAIDRAAIEARVVSAVVRTGGRTRVPGRVVEIPVCYEGPCAPDLAELAAAHGISVEAAARAHSEGRYVVGFLGFSAGFPYLDGLTDVLATPRLTTPRLRVPAGSVAIGGPWTGIYPFATAGGWRLIGRTSLRLFDPGRNPPNLLALGDEVRFRPIRFAEFEARASRP